MLYRVVQISSHVAHLFVDLVLSRAMAAPMVAAAVCSASTVSANQYLDKTPLLEEVDVAVDRVALDFHHVEEDAIPNLDDAYFPFILVVDVRLQFDPINDPNQVAVVVMARRTNNL